MLARRDSVATQNANARGLGKTYASTSQRFELREQDRPESSVRLASSIDRRLFGKRFATTAEVFGR